MAGDTSQREDRMGERRMEYSQEELKEALRAIQSLLGKCEKAQEKLAQGTSQWTLLANRIRALEVSAELIRREIEKIV